MPLQHPDLWSSSSLVAHDSSQTVATPDWPVCGERREISCQARQFRNCLVHRIEELAAQVHRLAVSRAALDQCRRSRIELLHCRSRRTSRLGRSDPLGKSFVNSCRQHVKTDPTIDSAGSCAPRVCVRTYLYPGKISWISATSVSMPLLRYALDLVGGTSRQHDRRSC